MNIELKEDFEIAENGTHYKLPMYKVVDKLGLAITGGYVDLKFVRGSKTGNEDVQKRVGTLHEHLLAVMIHDLKFKNELVPSEYTNHTIKDLESALNWIRCRGIDRQKRSVQGTYKK